MILLGETKMIRYPTKKYKDLSNTELIALAPTQHIQVLQPSPHSPVTGTFRIVTSRCAIECEVEDGYVVSLARR